jgi:hypothetical protein
VSLRPSACFPLSVSFVLCSLRYVVHERGWWFRCGGGGGGEETARLWYDRSSSPSHFFHRSLFFVGRYVDRLGRWCMTPPSLTLPEHPTPQPIDTIHTSLPSTVGGSKHRPTQNESPPCARPLSVQEILLKTSSFSHLTVVGVYVCVCVRACVRARVCRPICICSSCPIYSSFRESEIYTMLSPIILF